MVFGSDVGYVALIGPLAWEPPGPRGEKKASRKYEGKKKQSIFYVKLQMGKTESVIRLHRDMWVKYIRHNFLTAGVV